MKHETLRLPYEAPIMNVQLFEAEGILCISSGSGVNEGFEELDQDYTFEFTK